MTTQFDQTLPTTMQQSAEMQGRALPSRKAEAGPAQLTARHRLLISYMIDGCGLRSVCERIWIKRDIFTEDGLRAEITRRPEPWEPLKLIEAADMLRIRRRTARALMTSPAFTREYDLELRRYRDGEKVANIHTMISMRDDPGQGKAADRKVRLQAAAMLNGEMGNSTSISITNTMNASLAPGYILDLEERDEDDRPTIEHRST